MFAWREFKFLQMKCPAYFHGEMRLHEINIQILILICQNYGAGGRILFFYFLFFKQFTTFFLYSLLYFFPLKIV